MPQNMSTFVGRSLSLDMLLMWAGSYGVTARDANGQSPRQNTSRFCMRISGWLIKLLPAFNYFLAL